MVEQRKGGTAGGSAAPGDAGAGRSDRDAGPGEESGLVRGPNPSESDRRSPESSASAQTVGEPGAEPGEVVAGREAGREAPQEKVPDASAGPEILRGRVVALVKAGFEVELSNGVVGICSLSQMDAGRIQDASSYLHRDLDFAVSRPATEGGVVRLSRRRIVEREARAARAQLLARIVPGARLPARVARLAEFGVFVDLGGVEGLVHLTEISHRRIEHPAEALAVGEDVEVVVLRVDRPSKRKRAKRGGNQRPGRSDGRRISLSIKRAQEDPWKSASASFPAWQVADGRVTRVTEFGAFLEIAPGIEGLLHVSEVPPGALAKIEEASREGARMTVLVLHVDQARQRVALAAAPGGLLPGARVEPISLREGRRVVGRVAEVQSGAVVVRLGPGQLGVIPDNEMGTARGADLRSEFPPGAEIEAEVVRVESGGRRARLSRKRLLRREERAEVARHMRTQSSASLSTLGDLLARARASEEEPS